MKQHLSVVMLAARSTVYKLLGILALMAAAEGTLFYLMFQASQDGTLFGLETLITRSRISWVCGVCFLLLCAVLSLHGSELGGSKFRYTLGRLSVGERTLALWWAIYNIGCFFIFWGAQALLAFVLCRYYAAHADPSVVSGQTVFLAFYRSNFLHSLLPLAETGRVIRNLILTCALGITASCFSLRLRHDRKGIAVGILAGMAVVMFVKPVGSCASDVTISVIALIVTFGAVIGALEEASYENAA